MVNEVLQPRCISIVKDRVKRPKQNQEGLLPRQGEDVTSSHGKHIQINGNTLRICYADPEYRNRTRPTEFKAKDGVVLLTFKRTVRPGENKE